MVWLSAYPTAITQRPSTVFWPKMNFSNGHLTAPCKSVWMRSKTAMLSTTGARSLIGLGSLIVPSIWFKFSNLPAVLYPVALFIISADPSFRFGICTGITTTLPLQKSIACQGLRLHHYTPPPRCQTCQSTIFHWMGLLCMSSAKSRRPTTWTVSGLSAIWWLLDLLLYPCQPHSLYRVFQSKVASSADSWALASVCCCTITSSLWIRRYGVCALGPVACNLN